MMMFSFTCTSYNYVGTKLARIPLRLLKAMMTVTICSVAFHCVGQAALHALQKYKDTGKQCCGSRLMTD